MDLYASCFQKWFEEVPIKIKDNYCIQRRVGRGDLELEGKKGVRYPSLSGT